jgi:hypothetical protein
LVIYTDEENYAWFLSLTHHLDNIKIVVQPFEQLFNYRYKEFWIENHRLNPLLNTKVEWKVNLLWSEKVHFVEQTRVSHYFPETDYYGWIDIGYFRCRPHLDVPLNQLSSFANSDKIRTLNPHKIHYAIVNIDLKTVHRLAQYVARGQPLPDNQVSVGGGCFIGHKDMIEFWKNMYTDRLEEFIREKRLVKDDQIIVAHCAFSLQTRNFFELHMESLDELKGADPWFLFSRLLL